MTDIKTLTYSGWDIGGAHLKVARSDTHGNLLTVIQIPCALWKGIDQLEKAISKVLQQLNNLSDIHLITMTGELVDAFQSREHGVSEIIDCVSQYLSAEAYIYAGKKNWLSCSQAKQDWQAVASMNWQASASFIATEIEKGLFIDIGSTTCDIIPIMNHAITPSGSSDHERQASGELVYTGAIRTPLMAITDHTYFAGKHIRLAAEWFASSADIWVILDQLSAEAIQDNSADGEGWSRLQCQRRLARMLGTDDDNFSDKQWTQVAMWFAEKQIQNISQACLQVMSQHPELTGTPIIGAGVGRFIAKQCALRLNSPYLDYSAYCQNNTQAAEHAPATALTLLACRDFT